MGTRNLTCVYDEGKYKVAQYCQWDGYPSSKGVEILSFLRYKGSIELLKKGLKNCKFVTSEEVREMYRKLGADGSGYVNIEISDKFRKEHLSLHRDCGGAEILKIISLSDEEVLLSNTIDFAKDSVFCEWCYVIDFDKNTFEVYKGFNKNKNSNGRFNLLEEEKTDKEEYGAVTLVKSYNLNELPTDEVFLQEVEPEEE